MKSWGDYFAGFVLGAILGAVAILVFMPMEGTLDACRAAHPGYDCDFGWVKGEAFK